MKKILIVLGLVLILVIGVNAGGRYDDVYKVGEAANTRAVFDLQTGAIVNITPYWTHITGETIQVNLPPGVFIPNPIGPNEQYNGPPTNYVIGVMTREKMDSPAVLIPFYFFGTGQHKFSAEVYKFGFGDRIKVTKVVEDGEIISEVFTGVVTGHTTTKLNNGTTIPVYLVKYYSYNGNYNPVYDPNEDLVPAEQ